jgi:enoyl-CoA hydratase
VPTAGAGRPAGVGSSAASAGSASGGAAAPARAAASSTAATSSQTAAPGRAAASSTAALSSQTAASSKTVASGKGVTSSKTAVRVDRSGQVTTVILDRPEVRNAVDGPTAAALAEAFADFDADSDAAVAVLFGAGGTFCAGADLKAMGSGRGNRTEPDGAAPMGPSRMRLSKPVIAAVAGHAVAGGLELALWCDLRVAEEDAVFGVFCRRWGVPLIDGGTVRLPQVVGLGRALDLILTGRPVPAAEALQMGLVSRIVRHGEAREEAERLALQIAAFPQACVRSDRASTLDGMSLGFADAMANEFRRGTATLADPGVVEGVSRFRGGAGRGGAPA